LGTLLATLDDVHALKMAWLVCTYLAHHELESVFILLFIITFITVFIIIVVIIIMVCLQGLDLPALFAAVESNRSTLQIEDYSLSQTTLEQVFVALAQQNTEQQLQ